MSKKKTAQLFYLIFAQKDQYTESNFWGLDFLQIKSLFYNKRIALGTRHTQYTRKSLDLFVHTHKRAFRNQLTVTD